MYQVKFYLNLADKKKNTFIKEELIPFLHEAFPDSGQERKGDYYFSWSIEVVPVIVLYLKCETEYFQKILPKMQEMFGEFCHSLSEEEKKGNPFYIEHKKDIAVMNGLKGKKDIPENLTMEYEKVENIDRQGEYDNEEIKEIYNEYFFRMQGITEQAFLFIEENMEARAMAFVYGMFYLTAMQLDATGVGRGYLSFKSHLLGFLNYKNPDIEKYRDYFERYYCANVQVFEQMADILEDETEFENAAKESVLYELLWKFSKTLEELYEDFYQAEEEEVKESIKEKMEKKKQFREFRKFSQFHYKMFSDNNKEFFKLREFRAYRMLVNFVYLQLPRLGLSSRIRVEGAYMLVRTMEKEQGMIQIERE